MRAAIFKIDDKAYHARKMRENKARDRMPQEVIDGILKGMPDTTYRVTIREDGQETIIDNNTRREVRAESLDSYYRMILSFCRRLAHKEPAPTIGITEAFYMDV